MIRLVFRASVVVAPWIVLGVLSAAASAGEVRWRGDYGQARSEAVRLGRPIVIVVASEHCGWCRRLERTTLRDQGVIRLLNDSTVPLKIDADDPAHAAVIEALRVEGVPTIATLGLDGRVRSSHAGYLDPTGFMRLVRHAVDGSGELR